MTTATVRQSLIWEAPTKIRLNESRIPDVVPGSMLVKVHACAICGSDLRIFHHGNPRIIAPQIIGHEIAGEVMKLGEGVVNFSVGDRVAIGADIPCGECQYCRTDKPNCCDINYAIGYQFEGGFSEYILLNPLVVKYGPVQKFSDRLSYEEAALAEPLACCINGYERGLMQAGRSVVIFGAGPIGVMLAMLAPIVKASQVIVIDPSEERLNQFKALGLGEVINPNVMDPVKKVFELTKGHGAEMIFTACPVVETHEQAIAMVAKRGVINLFGGLPKTAPAINLNSNFIHYREAYITGSHGSTPKQHQRALQLIESGAINVKPLITHAFSLNEIHKAFEVAFSGKALKVMVKPHV